MFAGEAVDFMCLASVEEILTKSDHSSLFVWSFSGEDKIIVLTSVVNFRKKRSSFE
jgi:hypothetical protein